ncbi:MAG: NYN domain-containing protein [Rhodobacteraceae bacterium]|nr:NYN domain-containing protein [Paracoccaceae bacterium]
MVDEAGIRRLKWALLIDGENIGAGFADEILRLAGNEGALPIRRVYGDAARMKAWAGVSGLRTVHAGAGKNAADLLICIEAMEIFHSGQVEGILLAASDRDYSHLALHLRERGFRLVLLGEDKAPAHLQRACAKFVPLGQLVAPSPAPKPVQSAVTRFDVELKAVITELRGAGDWAKIGPLGSKMYQRHKVKRTETGCATWGKYLAKRTDICVTDQPAQPTRVKLRDYARRAP